jgi:hypothetical protein
MSGAQTEMRKCDKCGVSIPDDDFRNQLAARYKGKTLCQKCTAEVKARILAAKQSEAPDAPPEDISDVPVVLMEDVLAAPDKDAPSQIHAFSSAGPSVQKEKEYKRALLTDSRNATRCRTFHCKLTDASFDNLNEMINEWVDEHEDVQIKYALSDIGVVEGKHADPHLIVTLFY